VQRESRGDWLDEAGNALGDQAIKLRRGTPHDIDHRTLEALFLETWRKFAMHKDFLVALLALLSVFLAPWTVSANSGFITVSDYPRYGTNLSSSQRNDLRAFARALVGALIAGAQVDISLYGYADFDAKGEILKPR
jgi:hypothetical protein